MTLTPGIGLAGLQRFLVAVHAQAFAAAVDDTAEQSASPQADKTPG